MDGEFFLAAVHRLRGPLNVIAGWAGVLRTGRVGPDVLGQAADALERSCRLEVELVESVLELWALSEGSQQIERMPVELYRCLQAALATAQPLARARELDVHVTAGDRALVTLGDGPSLERLLAILLRHAIERSPEQSRVRVRLSADGAQARIDVVDAGAALDARTIGHLFDRFRPPEPAEPITQGRLNLDLAIARHLALLHQGNLAAGGSPDGGLTLTLSLRLA